MFERSIYARLIAEKYKLFVISFRDSLEEWRFTDSQTARQRIFGFANLVPL